MKKIEDILLAGGTYSTLFGEISIEPRVGLVPGDWLTGYIAHFWSSGAFTGTCQF